MNRREAIAALVSLPEITRISSAPIKPGDVIVIECDLHISMDAAERIKVVMSQVWPDRKCVVLDKGVTLKVVRP